MEQAIVVRPRILLIHLELKVNEYYEQEPVIPIIITFIIISLRHLNATAKLKTLFSTIDQKH